MEGNMEDPSFIPKLEMYNAKEKVMSIDRGGEAHIVNPSASYELRSGDKVNIVAGVVVEVEWRRVACVLPPARNMPSISRESCASIGISLVPATHPLATHHITPKYEVTIPIVTSLLSAAQLVRAEWLQEYIHLGTTGDDGNAFKLTAFEQTFIPPLESKYRPVFSPALPSSLKSFKFWEPSEERLNFLKGYRIVLLAGKDADLDRDTRELAVRGGGEYDGYPMTSGHAKWRQMLAKAKRKKEEVGINVVIVSNEQVIQGTVGSDKWQEMVADAQSMSIPIITTETLLDAVVGIDISIIHRTPASQALMPRNSSPLPDFIPNTHPDEPSLPTAPVLREEAMEVNNETRPRRTTEERDIPMQVRPTSPPAGAVEMVAPAPPRRKLLRRPKPVSTTSGHENSISPPLQLSDNRGSTVPPAPPTSRPKLKRRTVPQAPVTDPPSETTVDQEPPLKKFKALFDASDPDKMTADGANSVTAAYDSIVGVATGITQDAGSPTQRESSDARLAAPKTLDMVVEEEEESAQPGPPMSKSLPLPPPPNQLAISKTGKLRKATPVPEEARGRDTINRVEEHQASEEDNQTLPQPKKTSSTRQVDTDQLFLTAVASRKRGKKGEDDFDREFNKLRISKPDIHREQEEDWAVLGDFDDDVRNIRGNFMVVMDMDVYRNVHPRQTTPSPQMYDGKPNFKKFKKTRTLSSRTAVELVVKTEDDYGVGSGYWRDSTAPKDYTDLPPSNSGTQKRRPRTVLESDEEEDDNTFASKKTKKQPPKRDAKTKATPLFLESDEESSQGRRSQKNTAYQTALEDSDLVQTPARSSKRRHIIADDDSDEDTAFKGFGKKRRVR
ncbi:hypothetical protein ID866_2661 [Astraeus odoratus]|nr:hypothetical protein ID866_2661 [Astraeus odoratus]